MKILITGSSGFLGTNLQSELEKRNHTVVGYDYVNGYDIRDRAKLNWSISEFKPDLCIHLAAIANLNHYDDDKKIGGDINITGTTNILDICEKNKVRVIFASTCCCYGDNKLDVSYETSDVCPTEPYSKSKRTSELIILERNKQLPYHLKTVICRLATFYGSKHCRRALAKALFMEKIYNGEPIEIHGDGKQTRTYTHVHDMCTGFASIVDNISQVEYNIINISQETPISVLDIIKECKKQTNKEPILKFIDDRESQFVQGRIDNTRLRNLGWSPKYDFSSGMKELFESFKNNNYKWIL